MHLASRRWGHAFDYLPFGEEVGGLSTSGPSTRFTGQEPAVPEKANGPRRVVTTNPADWNGTMLSYDLDGNLSNEGTTAYTWNARNQLSAFGSVGFSYDSFGRRTQNAAGTAFLYDGTNPVQELSPEARRTVK